MGNIRSLLFPQYSERCATKEQITFVSDCKTYNIDRRVPLFTLQLRFVAYQWFRLFWGCLFWTYKLVGRAAMRLKLKTSVSQAPGSPTTRISSRWVLNAEWKIHLNFEESIICERVIPQTNLAYFIPMLNANETLAPQRRSIASSQRFTIRTWST